MQLLPLQSPYELFKGLWNSPKTIQPTPISKPIIIGQIGQAVLGQSQANITQFSSPPKASALPQLSFVSTLATAPSSNRLNLPPRSPEAPTGSQFFAKVQTMDRMKREELIKQEILNGNVPDHLRELKTIQYTTKGKDKKMHTVTAQVTPDYLAIGSNTDYVLVPMSPLTAQAIADKSGTYLPTTKLVNQIYKQAEIKLVPKPRIPTEEMMSTDYYQRHNQTISKQRTEAGAQAGQIIAGHKKDMVMTNALNYKPKSVAIYGWHKTNGAPIQPLSTIHENTYADYSHGARLIGSTVTIDGETKSLTEVLNDKQLAFLISDEGRIKNPRATRP